jgi:hypothetical protein
MPNDPKEPELRKNGQTKQPGIEYPPEGNGWAEPLNDESSPVKCKYTYGKDGSIEKRPVESVKIHREGGD